LKIQYQSLSAGFSFSMNVIKRHNEEALFREEPRKFLTGASPTLPAVGGAGKLHSFQVYVENRKGGIPGGQKEFLLLRVNEILYGYDTIAP
jgi:hypothetical protein